MIVVAKLYKVQETCTKIIVKKEIRALKEHGYANFILEQIEGTLEEQKIEHCLEVIKQEIEEQEISYEQIKKELKELKEKVAVLLKNASESPDDTTDKKTHVYFAA